MSPKWKILHPAELKLRTWQRQQMPLMREFRSRHKFWSTFFLRSESPGSYWSSCVCLKGGKRSQKSPTVEPGPWPRSSEIPPSSQSGSACLRPAWVPEGFNEKLHSWFLSAFQSDASLHFPPITHHTLLGNLFFILYMLHTVECAEHYVWGWTTSDQRHTYGSTSLSGWRRLLLLDGFLSSQPSSPVPGTLFYSFYHYKLLLLALELHTNTITLHVAFHAGFFCSVCYCCDSSTMLNISAFLLLSSIKWI